MFEEEIQQILKGVVNIRHKVILSTIYSGGLRTGELIKLPIKAIDSQRMQIRIEGGKGTHIVTNLKVRAAARKDHYPIQNGVFQPYWEKLWSKQESKNTSLCIRCDTVLLHIY